MIIHFALGYSLVGIPVIKAVLLACIAADFISSSTLSYIIYFTLMCLAYT